VLASFFSGVKNPFFETGRSLSVEEGGGEAERNYQESVAGFSRCKSWIFVSAVAGFVGSASTSF
jgi:hypothetical protein